MAPEERDRLGALPREAACHVCDPHPHHLFGCDSCLCPGDIAPGIDTALGG